MLHRSPSPDIPNSELYHSQEFPARKHPFSELLVMLLVMESAMAPDLNGLDSTPDQTFCIVLPGTF